MGSMKEKMHTGELYLPGDPEIVEEQTKRLDRLYDYNMTRPTEERKRQELLKEMLAEVGGRVLHRTAVSFKFRRRTCTFRKIRVCKFQSDNGG